MSLVCEMKTLWMCLAKRTVWRPVAVLSQPMRGMRSFRKKDVDEPAYLDYLKPQIPYYPLLNVQVYQIDITVISLM